jgi:hypothetical protein
VRHSEQARGGRPVGAEAESKVGVGSETHAGAGRTAREASWIKRARLSMSESVTPMVVAFEEMIKPNQGDLFKWRRAWEALRLSE